MVRAEQSAEGTPEERAAAERCSGAILNEYHAYVKKSAEQLQKLRHGNKAWWSRARQLLDMKPRCSSIPALRNVEGAWEFDATGKAELFANTFKSKYKLIPSEDPMIRQFLNATKAELLQEGILVCAQFPSLGIFINKKVGFRKN